MDWERAERAVHGGGTFAVEVTPVENQLELEIGIAAIRADGGVEMPIEDPKQSIACAELRTLDRALEHRLLLTEGQVLKRDRAVSAADQREGTEHDEKRGRHERSCGAIDQRINQSPMSYMSSS